MAVRGLMLALLLLAWVSVFAQGSVSSVVGVRIPVVVGLALGEPGRLQEEALLRPGSHAFRVVANTRWVLRVEVRGRALLGGVPLVEGVHVYEGRGRLSLFMEVAEGEVSVRIAPADEP